MRRLMLDHPPAPGVTWLTEAPLMPGWPGCAARAVHLARPAPLALLRCGEVELPGALLRAGWLELPGNGPLRAAGAPIALSRAADGGLARRAWAVAAASPIPEAHWAAARILGEGAVMALGADGARPVLRLGLLGRAWVTLPALDLPILPAPRIALLRGVMPRARLHWGQPGLERPHGPGPVTLHLAAAGPAEVVWEG